MCKYCDSTCKTQKLKTSIVHSYFCLQVCVQQTALDLLDKGYDVHILADGCSSRSQVDRMLALERLRAAGAFLTTSESVVFELLGDSKHPNFKEVQALVKTSAPDSGLLTKL
ncbi:Isochorismatase domain-containing protein 2 [Geodia barretti]|uniref:Isochorismatase domain-containing protein 2 n=1 Tax=Geodia barretti TaxID=519541 RepID=A0AA35RMZ3_GEOBA|nr:Isochorismatase domain-containing protein 2 [Geodia barretti]